MADVFLSYTRADQSLAHKIVELLEKQNWSVWWDTRISGGERWDAVIEREIKAAQCVVVLWTPQSIQREWVLIEAEHGRERGILVPVLIGCERPPFAFSLLQARNLTEWSKGQGFGEEQLFIDDVKNKVSGYSADELQQLKKLQESIARLQSKLEKLESQSKK